MKKTKIVSFRTSEETADKLKEIPSINDALRVIADKMVNPVGLSEYQDYQLKIARLWGEIKLFDRQFKINQQSIKKLQDENDGLVKILGENLNNIQFFAEQKDSLLNDIE